MESHEINRKKKSDIFCEPENTIIDDEIIYFHISKINSI